MRSAALTVAVTLTVVSAPSGVEGQEVGQALEGAWRVTRMTTGGRSVDSPQPGLLLFTGRYYSYMLVTGTRPRPDLPAGDLVTARELLAAWNPFTANAGTFEVSGDTMVRRPIVAKNPETMAPGAFNAYTFRLSADTLWTTTTGTESGPARRPTTVRYVRLR